MVDALVDGSLREREYDGQVETLFGDQMPDRLSLRSLAAARCGALSVPSNWRWAAIALVAVAALPTISAAQTPRGPLESLPDEFASNFLGRVPIGTHSAL